MMSVCVGFLYIVYSSFSCFRCIVRSRKFMDLCVSFHIVNFMVGCCLLNSASISSMFVLFWLYIRRMSSTYLKYPIILCFSSILVNLFVFHVLDIRFC
jgi:hypothetical protein